MGLIQSFTITTIAKGSALSYSDPQSLTISGQAITLPRVSPGKFDGAFRSADGTSILSVSHTYGRRTRRVSRLDHSKLSTDPFIPDRNVAVNMAVYTVVDTPLQGYSNADMKAVVDAYLAWLTATSGAKVTQLLGGEN